LKNLNQDENKEKIKVSITCSKLSRLHNLKTVFLFQTYRKKISALGDYSVEATEKRMREKACCMLGHKTQSFYICMGGGVISA
jgi:hypothetical protein